jgi:nitrite reductase/ring-hydroxylating ferredoxin subunit
LGLALEWEPDNFLDSEALYIRCCNHGAFFEIDTGNCIQGPCLGDALWALDYSIANGMIMLDEEALPAPRAPA